jgi:hypothetical protein
MLKLIAKFLVPGILANFFPFVEVWVPLRMIQEDIIEVSCRLNNVAVGLGYRRVIGLLYLIGKCAQLDSGEV